MYRVYKPLGLVSTGSLCPEPLPSNQPFSDSAQKPSPSKHGHFHKTDMIAKKKALRRLLSFDMQTMSTSMFVLGEGKISCKTRHHCG